MEEQFPVNSGNVPPPSQSTNLLSHQLNYQPNFQNTNGGLRRKTKEAIKVSSKLKLERILGLTSTSSNTIDTANDLIAYAAGAVVVIYNHKRNKQIALLYPPATIQSTTNTPGNAALNSMSNINSQPSSAPMITPLSGVTNNLGNNDLVSSTQTNTNDDKKATPVGNRAKPISCLAFSPDGNYIAVGEMGHQPRIFIWNVKEKKLLRELRSHKFGVLALAFSPNMRYLVSIGFQHDGYLYVWDWKKGTKLAGNKVTSRVNAVSFAKDGSYFVTAGLRHVKFWYLDTRGRLPKRGNSVSRETQVLDGRSGILGVLRDANFVDVACDQGSTAGYTYFITDTGILCIFKEGRVIDKWVDLQVKGAYSIAVSPNYVICTCSEGVIRLFEPGTLKYVGILPKPHPLGIDVTTITSPDMIRSPDANTFYPDAVAMVYDANAHRLTCVYSDRSLYVWDIRDLKKIGKYRSFIFHSDCVWGVEPCPNIEREDNAIPLNSFATFSGDGTIRIWNLDNPIHNAASTSTSPISPQQLNHTFMSPSSSTAVGLHRRNIYSRELVKMLYVDPDAAEFAKLRSDFEHGEDNCPDFGIRSLKMSRDGHMMASGDRKGNLRVHDMNSWEMMTYQEAHDSEILSIDITTPKSEESPSLVATASRDRLLHVFDAKSKFQLVQSLDDHSSSITSVKFSEDASRLISCGADKGIIFRNRTHPVTLFHDNVPRPFSTYHNYSGRSTVFDMALDVSGRYVATVTGERKLYVFSVESGKPFRTCRPETSDEVGKSVENSGGSLINIDLDPFSGTYAVTSGSDRCIRLFDLTNSTCIEKVCAHSELITSIKFVRTNLEENGLRVVSTCSDGTIFVWKVGQEIIAKMTARASEREVKMKQRLLIDDDDLSDIDEKRALALGLQINKRIRRVSTVASIRPTASISQMIRQGERRTFSSMSPAEQKYDDLYKKIAASSNRRNNIDTNTIPHNSQLHVQTQLNENASHSGPVSPVGNRGSNTNRSLLSRREPRLANNLAATDNQNNINNSKLPQDKVAKLDRLYNGVPTNGGRDRPSNHITSPVSITSQRNPLQPQQAPLSTIGNHNLISGNRHNQVLRRAMSKEGLRKVPATFTSATKQLLQQQQQQIQHQKEPSSLARKSSQPSLINNRRSSDPQAEAGGQEDDLCISESPKVISKPLLVEEGSDNDADVETGRDEADDIDDDDEEEEIEEEIIFTAEQDKIIKPFEVSMHLAPSSCEDEEEDGRITPVSDNENNHNKVDEEDDGSSEENVDDAINRAIVAREPPRVSVSISRTTSSVANSSRRRSGLLVDITKRLSAEAVTAPSSPPSDECESSSDSPSSPNNPAFREIQRNLEKAAKRQSLTARFLSSLGGPTKLSPDMQEQDSSLNHIMSSLQGVKPQAEEVVTTEALPPNKKVSLDKIEINTPIPSTSSHSNSEAEVPSSSEHTTKSSDKETPQNMSISNAVEDEKEEDPSKLENALADLEGIAILLDSVMDVYMSTTKTSKNEKTLSNIESKLTGVADRITQTMQNQSNIPKTSPETLDLLEKYSSLLIGMVGDKLRKS